jgi:hypothetical protein
VEVDFVPANGRDGSLVLMVRVNGSVVGHIRRDAASRQFRYQRLLAEEGALVHEDEDLEALLQRVARRP